MITLALAKALAYHSATVQRRQSSRRNHIARVLTSPLDIRCPLYYYQRLG